jgi:Flp pilus assembly pilin Flp
LIVALIAVAVVGAMRNLGGGSNGMWTRLANHVEDAST